MKYFPLFLNIDKIRFLIVGAGNIALAKLESILEFTDSVEIIARDINDNLSIFAKEQGVIITQNTYKKEHLNSYDIVIAATNDESTNEQIALDAKALGKLANIVDAPAHSDFIFGANFKNENIIVSAVTSGISPVLSRILKQKFKNALPQNILLFDEFIKKNRDRSRKKLTNLQARRIFWQDVLEGSIGQEIAAGNIEKAQELFDETLHSKENLKKGAVYFIGAGPGDPELMTIKGVNLLSRADIVLYDRLVSPEILDYARRDAVKINVGKTRDLHRYTQAEINELLKKHAAEGNIVARLKGGDPSLFGHLTEEIDAIKELNVNYQIIPGITAASGAAAYSGIPLTSRASNKSARFLTVYKQDLLDDKYWEDLSVTNDTLIFYMSSHNLSSMIEKFSKFGRDKKTKIAVIEQATTKYQKTYVSDLESYKRDLGGQKFISPSLVIVGDVVAHHETYKWREELQKAKDVNLVYFNDLKKRNK